jgi:hypothetical protein
VAGLFSAILGSQTVHLIYQPMAVSYNPCSFSRKKKLIHLMVNLSSKDFPEYVKREEEKRRRKREAELQAAEASKKSEQSTKQAKT